MQNCTGVLYSDMLNLQDQQKQEPTHPTCHLRTVGMLRRAQLVIWSMSPSGDLLPAKGFLHITRFGSWERVTSQNCEHFP